MTPEKSSLADDLLALANMQDEDIDTSEIAERADFSNPRRGRYFDLAVRDYDIRAVANWFINRAQRAGQKITSMWLNKIVYLTHESALREFRTLLSPAKVEAWNHGPMFREIHFQLNSEDVANLLLKFNPNSRKREVALEDFNETDLKIFEKAWKNYGSLSASALRGITHQKGSPWDMVWSDSDGTRPGMEIDISLIIGQIGQGHGRR